MDSSGNGATWSPSDAEVVDRALKYSYWVKQGRVLAKAFYRRPYSVDSPDKPWDEDGLSVVRTLRWPVSHWEQQQLLDGLTGLSSTAGYVSLRVGALRQIEGDGVLLDVLCDAVNDNGSCHGNILHVPFRGEGDEAEAQRVATALRDAAEAVVVFDVIAGN